LRERVNGALWSERVFFFLLRPEWNGIYCKRLNFREDLILHRSREQFGHYVNTTEATFDSRKLEPANNFKISALARFAKI
ncbi:MAG: hypothetical protein PV344_05485, partial [Anaplasma sp.]|nr:hypothetical protein [Anaplasma sp.]